MTKAMAEAQQRELEREKDVQKRLDDVRRRMDRMGEVSGWVERREEGQDQDGRMEPAAWGSLVDARMISPRSIHSLWTSPSSFPPQVFRKEAEKDQAAAERAAREQAEALAAKQAAEKARAEAKVRGGVGVRAEWGVGVVFLAPDVVAPASRLPDTAPAATLLRFRPSPLVSAEARAG